MKGWVEGFGVCISVLGGGGGGEGGKCSKQLVYCTRGREDGLGYGVCV